MALLCFAFFNGNNLKKAIYFNFSLIILTAGFFELYLYFKGNAYKFEGINTDKYAVVDEDLGYVPVPNAKVNSAKKYFRNKLIYDVTYSIDKNGLRLGPPTNDYTNGDCVVFFGDSFTYGEGVNDHETLPYLVEMKSNGRYRTYNFGFHAYGPHQMLAQLEKGHLEKRLPCKPKYAVYQAIGDQVYRSVGLSPYIKHGSRYALNPDGSLLSKGHFDDLGEGWKREHFILSKMKSQLNKSAIVGSLRRKRTLKSDDIALFVAIVDNARKIFEMSYPGSRFYVIYWDAIFTDREEIRLHREVLSGLKNKAIEVYLISRILPKLSQNKMEYLISPYDAHPNSKAYQIIADYVLDNIFSK